MWKLIKDYPIPEYDWVILGKCIEEDNTLTWQIGRKLPNGLRFWDDDETAGPWRGDCFFIWKPEEATHWIYIPDTDEE